MNECILVVDDDREIVGAIAIVLEREGIPSAGHTMGWERWSRRLTRRYGSSLST